MYHHERVQEGRRDAAEVVAGLFSRYSARPDLMPQEWQAQVAERETAGQARIVADYIAGMTDR